MPAYRDDDSASRARLQALIEERTRALDEIDPRVRAIFVKRVARAAGGAVASLGGAAILLVCSQSWIVTLRTGTVPLDDHRFVERNATLVGGLLLGTLAGTALIVALVQRHGGRLFVRATFPRFTEGNPRESASRLESFLPRNAVRSLLKRVERASVLWPLVAGAQLAPILLWSALVVLALVIMLLVKLPADGVFAGMSCKDFPFRLVGVFGMVAELVSTSCMFAEVVLIASCIRYACKVTSTKVRTREVNPKEGWGLAYALTIVPSLASVAVIYTVGFILGPLTFLFVPWMFRSVGARLLSERAELAIALADPEPRNVDRLTKD